MSASTSQTVTPRRSTRTHFRITWTPGGGRQKDPTLPSRHPAGSVTPL
jgi:hypothetical protein